MTGQHVDETILKALIEEDADQMPLGWQGTHTRQGHVFGPNLDSVVETAPCEVSLVTLHDETIGTAVALASPGPHAPVGARRADEFSHIDDTSPTLLNVQRSETDDDIDLVKRGMAVIDDVADRARLDPEEYDT